MTSFHHIFKQDYDKRIFLGGEFVFGYSERKLRALYQGKNHTIVGEAKSTKSLKKQSQKQQEKKKQIGQLHVNGKELDLFARGEHNSILHKREGYVCVGEDTFVEVHSSRIPFLLTLLAIIALIIVTAVLIVGLLSNPKPPVVIDPDPPLPDIDPDVEILPDNGDKVVSENGGGFVSMVYTKDATVSLSANKATIYYQNPNKSNHSVVLELYIVSDGQEYFLGRTGLIPAGSAIYGIDVTERDANIRAGIYTGLYRMFYYDPLTGERAAISSNITEVTVSVTE